MHYWRSLPNRNRKLRAAQRRAEERRAAEKLRAGNLKRAELAALSFSSKDSYLHPLLQLTC